MADASIASATINPGDLFHRHPIGLMGYSVPYYQAYINDPNQTLHDVIQGMIMPHESHGTCHSVRYIFYIKGTLSQGAYDCLMYT